MRARVRGRLAPGLVLSLLLLAACGPPVAGRTLLGRWALGPAPECPAPATAPAVYEFHADGTYQFQTVASGAATSGRYTITGPNRIRLDGHDYLFALNTEATTLRVTAAGAECPAQYARVGTPPVPE